MERKPETVAYIAHESDMSRLDRLNHRLFVLCLVLIFLLTGSNAAWLYYESQWQMTQTTTQTVEQNSLDGGINTFVGDDFSGESKSQDNNN